MPRCAWAAASLSPGFRPAAPNVLWCTDITYLETGKALLLAAVQDLYSRRYARRRPVISTIARRRHTTVLWVSLLAVLVAITVSLIASIRDSDGRPVPTVLAAGAPGQDAMAI
jgi:transposase InsO family protein